MHPRLQTAFDVMYANAERFIPNLLRADLTQAIRNGDMKEVAAAAAKWLLLTSPRNTETQAHRKAVAAFGHFWSVFTELMGATPQDELLRQIKETETDRTAVVVGTFGPSGIIFSEVVREDN